MASVIHTLVWTTLITLPFFYILADITCPRYGNLITRNRCEKGGMKAKKALRSSKKAIRSLCTRKFEHNWAKWKSHIQTLHGPSEPTAVPTALLRRCLAEGKLIRDLRVKQQWGWLPLKMEKKKNPTLNSINFKSLLFFFFLRGLALIEKR